MPKNERLLPAIVLIVFSALFLMAIETSETLAVDGRSPSERLASALSSTGSVTANPLSNSNTLDAR